MNVYPPDSLRDVQSYPGERTFLGSLHLRQVVSPPCHGWTSGHVAVMPFPWHDYDPGQGCGVMVLGLEVTTEIISYISPSPLVLFSSILSSLYTHTSLEHLNTMGWPVWTLSFYPFRNKSCTQEQWCCWNNKGHGSKMISGSHYL